MKLHYSLLIVLMIALYTNMLIEFAIFFLCIILHELGHLFFILIFRQKVNHLTLTIFGGELNCHLHRLPIYANILIYSGGVIVNLILISLAKFVPARYYNIFYNYNYLLIAFNLLPIYPLDGYKILEAVISISHNPHREFLIASFFSLFSIIGLMVYSILMNSLGLVIITIYLLYRNIQRINNKDRIVIHKFIQLFS